MFRHHLRMPTNNNDAVRQWLLSQKYNPDAAKRTLVFYWVELDDGSVLPVLNRVVPLWVAKTLASFHQTALDVPRFIVLEARQPPRANSSESQDAQQAEDLSHLAPIWRHVRDCHRE